MNNYSNVVLVKDDGLILAAAFQVWDLLRPWRQRVGQRWSKARPSHATRPPRTRRWAA
jgi:hypothetical protein